MLIPTNFVYYFSCESFYGKSKQNERDFQTYSRNKRLLLECQFKLTSGDKEYRKKAFVCSFLFKNT